MAPPKTRGTNFLNVGVEGRRTGVTLADTGARDEHGMELIDGIFSSPAKSSPKKDIVQSIEAVEEDEIADTVDGIAHGVRGYRLTKTHLPQESPNRTTTRKPRTSLLPPVASPSRTGLRSPAIRHPSLGRASSPVGPHLSSPARRPAPDVRRQLDFTKKKTIPGVEQAIVPEPVKSSPRKANKRFIDFEEVSTKSKKTSATPVEGTSNHRLPSARKEKAPVAYEEEEEEEEIEVAAPPSARTQRKPPREPTPEEEPILEVVGDDMEEPYDMVPDDPLDVISPQLSSSRKRQREYDTEPAPAPVARMTKSPKGKQIASRYEEEPAQRPKARPKPKAQPVYDISEEEDIDVYVSPKPRKRVRKTPELSESPPRHRGKAAAPVNDSISLKKSSTKAPRERDPNVRAPARARAPSEISVEEVEQKANPQRKSRGLVSQGTTFKRGSSTARSLQREVSEDPNKKSRSGRAIIKPLAYWRNERIIYGEAQKKKNGIIVLPSIREVVRTEDVEESKPRAKSEAKKKKRKRDSSEELDEEDEKKRVDPALEPEPWEGAEGLVRGNVRTFTDDIDMVEEEVKELAYAGSAILTRDVANSDFRMAKTLALPFFGTGYVDIPPAGRKNIKSSGRMHLAFFVHEGKAIVNISGNEFGISKGGVFQVPRGNLYSIANPSHETTTRIFFAQACEVLTES